MAIPGKIKSIKELGRKEILMAIARDPLTGRVYVGGSDAKAYGFDPSAEKPEFLEFVGHESYVTGVAVANKHLVSGGYDGRLIWWDTESRQPIRTVAAHTKWIRRVQATIDGKLVASVADDMVCRLWDGNTGELRHELRGHEEKTPHHFPSMLYACAFSADGTRVVTADRVGQVVVWDTTSGKKLHIFQAPVLYTWDPKGRIHSIGGARSVAISHDNKFVAVGGMGQVGNIDHLEGKARVELFDCEKGERVHEFVSDQFKGLVEKLAFNPSGDWLAAAGGDSGGFFQLFDLKAGKATIQEKMGSHIHDFVFNEAYDTFYAAMHQRFVAYRFEE